MQSTICTLTAVFCLGHDPADGTGYLLVEPGNARPGAVPFIRYEPREGDLVFYDDHSKMWTALFALAGTGPPLHMGMVVRKYDGTLAVLEAGPDDSVWVDLRELTPRLQQFRRDFAGTITIRRCKQPPNRWQSLALTRFAHAQNGKRYAVLWLLAQGTPLRSRGALEHWLGKTSTKRDSWICSELAVAAGTVAGLIDPAVVHSNVAYPRDLVDNRRYDLSAAWHDPAEWRPEPVVRNAYLPLVFRTPDSKLPEPTETVPRLHGGYPGSARANEWWLEALALALRR